MTSEEQNMEAADFCSQHSYGECVPTEPTCDAKTSSSTELLDKGCMQYGCSHYRRRCRIRAPCCNEIFDCRHCHNEAKNSINIDQKHRHDIPRHRVQQVICSLCDTEQEVQQFCINCGVCMGRYFCETCKLFDDDTSKKQYHCNGCGICRIGGRENFFHCNKCRCCYSVLLKNSHPCVEGAMHNDCPVCFEYLFESRNDVTVMPCGHTIHESCLKDMHEHYREMWDWHGEGYCLQKETNLDISPCLWDGVSQNEEDLSYMFDETTPVKACGDLAYHVADNGVQAYLAGLTFALAASPCSTPVLATLLGYVAASKDPVIGGSLLLTYTTGYVAPLLLAASFAGALQSLLSFRKFSAWINPMSGALLLGGGIYTLLDRLFPVTMA